MAAYWRKPACHDWAKKKKKKKRDFTVPREISPFSEVFWFSSRLSLSNITMPIAESLCHNSTPCQHFTDSYRQWELEGGGGEGQECLQESEKRKMGGGEGCSGMKASAMMLHRGKRRCQNKTLSLLVTDIFRQFHRLKLDKHRGLVWLEGNRLR